MFCVCFDETLFLNNIKPLHLVPRWQRKIDANKSKSDGTANRSVLSQSNVTTKTPGKLNFDKGILYFFSENYIEIHKTFFSAKNAKSQRGNYCFIGR